MLGTSKSIAGFDPRSIPGCQVWLDGSDPAATGVIPADGASVSTWVDKSGNGYNFTASSAAVYSQGSNGIAFNNNLYSSTYPANPTTETIFIISTPTVVTSGQALISGYSGSRAVWVGWTGASGNQSAGVARTGIEWLAYIGTGAVFINTRNMTTVTINAGRSYIAIDGQAGAAYSDNGAAVGTATFTAGTVTYLGRESGASYGYYGYVHEIIIYNTYLTPEERESVQGYLFWKWPQTRGQSANRSDVNAKYFPFFTTPPFSRPFNPIDIPRCILWLDGLDFSTTGAASTVATGWLDKSGNSNNMTAAGTITVQPGGGMYLGGAAYFLRSLPVLTGVYTIFVVFYKLDGNGPLYYTTYGGSGLNGFFPNYAGTMYLSLGNQWYTIGNQFPNYTLHVVSITFSGSTTGSRVELYQNGSLVVSTTLTGNYADPFNVFYLGFRTLDLDNVFTGYMYEVVAYSNVLSTSQRQRVEGYLAKKWNLVGNLPLVHPYKKFPSSATLPFSPTNNFGCRLWLDGADFVCSLPNGVGGAVPVWNDKAGQNNAYPGVIGSVFATSNGVSFTGTNYMTLSAGGNMPISNSPFILFVVETLTGSGGYYFGDDNVNSGGISNSSLHVGYRNQGQHTFAFYNNDLEDYNVSGSGVRRIWTHWLPAGSNRVTRRNGATDVTHGDSLRLLFWTAPRIGRVFGGNNYTGTIHEIIVLRGDIGLQNVQAVEGYLSWKWQVALATTHPYYKFPPSQLISRANSGTPIGNLILFLDPQTYVSGASTWFAELGNTWNVYNSPTVTKLNNYNILTFNGTNQYCYDPTGVNFTGAFSINIWIQLSAPATQGNILQETNGGYQWTDLYVTGSTLYVGTYQINNVSVGAATTAWTNICFTNSANGASTLTTYVNGVRYGGQSYTRTAPGGNSFFYITGSSGNTNWGFKAFSLGVMSFHSSALRPDEVLWNYNTHCTRYGLPFV